MDDIHQQLNYNPWVLNFKALILLPFKIVEIELIASRWPGLLL